MCQCHLGDLAREIRSLGGPIAKRRTEAMGGEIIALHAAQQHQDCHVAQLRKDEAIAEADTLLLTIPNQLGVAYNVHAIEAILTHIAPALGLR